MSMLGRAVLPLLRPRTFPPAVRITLTGPQSKWQTRAYAKDRRSRSQSDYSLPASAPPRRLQPRASIGQERREGDAQSQHFSPGNKSSAGEHSGTQPEFETSTNTRENIPSKPEEIYRENSTIESSKTSPVPEKPPSQDEHQPTPQQRLPDLTQGIPSTLDAELSQARVKVGGPPASLNITEDPSEPTPSGGDRGRDGLPKSAYVSSNERKRNTMIKYAYLIMAGGFVAYSLYLGRNWESEEQEKKHPDAPSGWGLGRFYTRVKARLGSTLDYYNEPAFPKLLPDEEKDPNLRFPFTLVLSLEDLLVHQEWSRESGWRIAKRPGVDYFLRYLSQYYELVVFTNQPFQMAEQVLRKLDPFRMVRWPLFREATLYKDGQYIKDLSYLNRDLKKVILIDTEPEHAKNQPENAIIIPRWTGDPKDQTLIQMIPFLEYLATMGIEDARVVLKSFEGKEIPVEFARREKLLRDKFEAQMAEERKKQPKRGFKIGSLLGGRMQGPDVVDGSGEGFDRSKMIWDQVRERGQKQYELLDKQIREDGQKWLAEMAEEEKKAQEEAMKSMKTGFTGWFGLGGGGQEKK